MSLALERALGVAVEAVGLEHHYAPGRGLEPVSFTVESPGAVAVTGVNGSGKSTLFKIVAGLVRPSGGALALAIDGVTVPAAERRRHLGFASPELTFYDEFTAAENLGFAGEAMGLDDARGRAQAALERVGLDARAGDRVAALSSGMKQRLRIAFALLSRPALLLLDEPGSHLDEAGRAVVTRVIDEQRRSGLVLIATNDEREWRLAERRIELRGPGLGHSS